MQLRALVYADWRAALNDLRRGIRSPGRILLWLLYASFLGVFIASRIFTGHRSRSGGGVSIATADYFVCALLVTLVFALATGRGAIGIFRSRVEARFIIGSPVGAPLAIAYLQARESVAQSFRYVSSLLYIVVFLGPREIGGVATLVDLVLVLGVFAACAAIVVPRRLLSPRAGLVFALAGIPLGLWAIAPALRDAAAQLPLPPAFAARLITIVPAWHPGRILLEPNVWWLVVVVVLVAVAIGALAAAGRDAYPELYALSLKRIDRRERLRSRRKTVRSASTAMSAVQSARVMRVSAPPGVAVFVWKSMVEFGRSVHPRFIVAGSVLWGLAGFGAARFVAADSGQLFATLMTVVINVMLIAGITATYALANELRRPLFWLAPAAVFERLCALAIAQTWRTIATLEVIAGGFAIGGGKALEISVFAFGLPAFAILLTGVGFAAYALFPSSADQRGPVAALRFGIGAVLLVPPLVVYGVGAAGFGAPMPALFAAALLALIESGALVGVAAWRVDGHLDRLAATA